jgi:hypothetical protein
MTMGFGLSTFTGAELENYRPYFGYKFGVYHKFKLSKKSRFSYEIVADLRGSKFKVIGDTTYSKISTFYLNLPMMYHFAYKSGETSENSIFIGGQVSRLLVSSLFVGVDIRPFDRTIPLQKFDYGIVAGHKWDKQFWGLGMSVYIGLNDINDNIHETDNHVPGFKGTGKEIGNMGFTVFATF